MVTEKIRIKDYSRITLSDLHEAIAELYGIGGVFECEL